MYGRCFQMTFSKIRTNAVGKTRTDWKNSVLFLTKNLHQRKSPYGRPSARKGLLVVEKNVDGPVYRQILKKEPFAQFTVIKKFLKFWFQWDGSKAHTADLTLDFVETHFKKRVISNSLPLKKGELELAAIQPRSQFFRLFLLRLCKRPVLRIQTDNNFGCTKKYRRYFQLASRESGHFLVVYPELPEAFGTNCGEKGWTHRKRYNLSCLTRVFPLNLVQSTIFNNFFHGECCFWKTL